MVPWGKLMKGAPVTVVAPLGNPVNVQARRIGDQPVAIVFPIQAGVIAFLVDLLGVEWARQGQAEQQRTFHLE